jgi:D-alanine-D-alanine ligase
MTRFPERTPVTDPEAFGRVAVLMGGSSAEREISLLTGNAVLSALQDKGIDAHGLDPAAGLAGLLDEGGFDRIWLALHGRGGEDGAMQGALETLGLPYTGSGVAGSAIAMDKLRSKQLFGAWGLGTPGWAIMGAADEAPGIIERLGLPLMVKPAREGSSVGMARVELAADLVPAWEAARRFDSTVLVEAWVTGGEYSVPILQGTALPMVRIETPRVFYDYEAKYFADDTRYFCPAGLAPDAEAAYAEAALTAFRAVGASGWGRVDFLLPEDGQPRFLEVNTIPGMTSHSLVPMGAREAGIGFEDLAWRVLETSFAEREAGLG